MGLIFHSSSCEVFLLVAIIYGAIRWWFSIKFNYWKLRGIPCVSPSFPCGNIGDLLLGRLSTNMIYQKIYDKLDGHQFGGLFHLTKPVFIIRDLELVKNVLVKDFVHFNNRFRDTETGRGVLSKTLFLSAGPKWRKLRLSVSPTVTPSKIKAMFNIFSESAKDMMDFLQEKVRYSEDLEVKALGYDFTTDVMCSFAFGQRINCMKNPDSEFRLMGHRIIKELTGGSLVVKIIASFFTIINRALNCRCQPIQFFEKVVTETIEHREKNGWFRNDLLQFLMKLREKGEIVSDDLIEDSFPQKATKGLFDMDKKYEQLVLHCLELFLAGYDTMSMTIGFCLHELSVNPDIQHTLREEIDRVLKEFGGEITYEAVHKMEYLDKVLSETLRMYPAGGTLFRTCTKSYMIPGTKTLLEKGVQVVIPVYALHHDPKYYPDPEKFDPERFNEQIKACRPQSCYLPFGEGPKMCLGVRLALLEIKVAVVALLSKYELSVSKKTSLPIRLDPRTVTLSVEGDIWLRIRNRK
uniref:Cytochrome P450 n=1 Tax=Timema monikensis TaxID=170555 RepID=A0A7R9EL29_9NEOP|nr:unnamed protein product [Timema monikensis]